MTPEFSAEQLTNLAGEAGYAEGVRLFSAEAVRDWQQTGHTITAAVLDEQIYHVSLNITAKGIDSTCNCPVSEGFDFCQHCVAAALSVQQRSDQGLASTAETSGIHTYLNGLSKQQLLGQLEALIQTDPLLQRRFIRQAQIASGAVDIAALRKQITQALPYRKLSQRQKIRHYFEHACSELTDLDSCLNALAAEAALKLCGYTLERLNQVLIRFDPQGYQHPCAELCCQQYSQQLLRQNWPDEQLATYLLDQLEQPREIFPDPLSILAPGKCLELLIRQARQRWQKQPANRPLAELLHSYASEYADHGLLTELLNQPASRGDNDTILQFIQVQLEQLKRPAENLSDMQREEICQQLQTLFNTLNQQSPDLQQRKQQQHLQAEFATLQGNERLSAELYWQLFTEQKNQTSYLNYQQANTEQGISAEQSQQTAEHYLLGCAQRSSKEGHQALTQSHEHLFEFYLASSQLHKARIIADQLTLSPAHLEALALQLLSSEPQHSQHYYRRILNNLLQEASEEAYLYIAELLLQIPEYATEHPLCQPAAQQLLEQLLTELRQQHQHKRQFIRILAAHFPG